MNIGKKRFNSRLFSGCERGSVAFAALLLTGFVVLAVMIYKSPEALQLVSSENVTDPEAFKTTAGMGYESLSRQEDGTLLPNLNLIAIAFNRAKTNLSLNGYSDPNSTCGVVIEAYYGDCASLSGKVQNIWQETAGPCSYPPTPQRCLDEINNRLTAEPCKRQVIGCQFSFVEDPPGSGIFRAENWVEVPQREEDVQGGPPPPPPPPPPPAGGGLGMSF